MDAKWRLDFADASTSGNNAPANPPGYASLRELGDGDASNSGGGGGGKGKIDAPKGGGAVAGPLTSAARTQKAYQFAMSQVQAIGMTGFMMYMAGSGVQIFSMMVVGNGLFQPIKAIMASGKTFERFADASTDVTGPRLVFCAIQLAGLAMGLYKLNSMGLLPTHASDWVSGMKPPTPVEHAYGGTTL